jgi:ADP-ribose pyrophosphatase YjhB (NUDIX family)
MTVAARVEVAVGAIVRSGDEVLLVRRGRGAAVGKWSVPGGRVEFGEPITDAVAREVFEETGLTVRVTGFAGWVERIGDDPFPYHYVILDFFAAPDPSAAATPRAGDDAAAVRWVPIRSLGEVDLVDGLLAFLGSVGVGGAPPG